MREKRKNPRIKKNLPFTIGSGKGLISTQTKNISCSGAYCAIDRSIPPMSRVKVAMTIPLEEKGRVLKKKVTCKGIVVRCEPPAEEKPVLCSNAAIMFTDISDKNKDIIAGYVNRQMAVLKERIL